MKDFQALQQSWTQWLRQPEHYQAPQEIEPRRLAIYRELVFNNIASFLDNGFPIIQQQLPEMVWQALQHEFFAQHHCQSPYFYEIAAEFLQFLQQRPQDSQYPWLVELAHFEWAELAADTADAAIPMYVQGDIWQQIPVLSPYVWGLVYQWPVHLFAHKHYSEISCEISCLLIFRNVKDEVNISVINPIIALFFEMLQSNVKASAEQLLAELVAQTGHDRQMLFSLVQPVVESWQEQQIILGVRP